VELILKLKSMKTQIKFIALWIIVLSSCSKQRDSQAEEAAKRVAQLEAQLAIQQQQANDKPSITSLVEAAKIENKNTFAYDERCNPLPPVFEISGVTVKGSSRDGAMCHMIVDVQAKILPDFYKFARTSDGGGGFTSWVRNNGGFVDLAWRESQRKFIYLGFNDVKLLFRRYDSGWRYEKQE